MSTELTDGHDPPPRRQHNRDNIGLDDHTKDPDTDLRKRQEQP
ncbi:hypothetical protein ACNJ7E_13255 [Rhodococcus sp. NM-2]|uniref:Uncharacterized protein n=1 Tax=Rhodococcus wratislaviensis TaxID=44752 RepID=A0A402C261_RHOWR|nr:MULTISPECIES: hypothetical protein [Rhodococcus]GCE37729.1 hypothetical protein Rhow_000575 [Rhodococcus wratislaviensis]